MSNQRRVYEAEQAALQERKLTEARLEVRFSTTHESLIWIKCSHKVLQEIRRERQIEETQKQLEASGGPKRVDRVEWMYQGTNDGGRDEYSSEAFLLGKRRIDSILRGDDAKKVEKTAGPTGETPGPLSVVASARDTAAKIREDPLVAIKRQEQEAYQAMMKDPMKRRQLLAQMGIAEEKPAKSKQQEDRHRGHRHRSRRHHDDEDSEHRRHRRRRRGDSRDRSRSPRRHDDDQDYERRNKRRRSDSRDEPSSKRHYSDESDNDRRYKGRRSDSRERRRYESDEEYRTKEKERDRRDQRPSDGDGRDSREARDTSRRRYIDGYQRQGGTEKRDYRDRRRYNGHNMTAHSNGSRSDEMDEEERARKLAAMRNDATDLDKVREARLNALAEKEQAEREADNQARSKASKYGGRDFANRLHNAAGNESLADRIGRGRQGLQRDED